MPSKTVGINPRKLPTDPVVLAKVRQLISAGNHQSAVCRYLGINIRTWQKWMQDARERPNSACAAFARMVAEAEAECEVRLAAQWQQQCPNDWKAAHQFLATRFPERWGNQVRLRVEVQKAVESTLDELEKRLPPELFVQVLEALEDCPTNYKSPHSDLLVGAEEV